MRYNPDLHHRRSIRLKGYVYSQAGAYFVTLCTQNRECLFGEIINGKVQLKDAGRMVKRWWMELSKKFPTIGIDRYIIMPNHIHGIIWIQYQEVVGADLRVCPDVTQGAHTGAPLPTVMQWFKTMTSNDYIRHVKKESWPPLHGKLWQRSYYEHIIGSEDELIRTSEYILNNPAHWAEDENNPALMDKGNGKMLL
jgi:REP-associated tyrosine transposase